jgi:putative drug exporter of the RND superfamily
MRTLARWCFTHRRVTLAAWLAALVAVTAIHFAVGSAYKDTFRLHGTDSADALQLLKRGAPRAAGDLDRIVVATKGSATLNDPAIRARVKNMVENVASQPHVAKIGQPQIAPGGRIGYVPFNFDVQANRLKVAAIRNVISTAQRADSPALEVELGGQAIQNANRLNTGGTALGMAAAALVLFAVFGSLLAMALPLITAAVSLGVGVAVIGLVSHAIQTATFSSELSLLIGLGVGVDYALFIVTRYRQALLRGRPIEEAAVDAVDTSGRAVLFAGMTVCIALLGMFALGVSFLYGVAIAASLVVAFTVLASLTLLPSLLGFFGTKVLRRKERRALQAEAFATHDESPAWGRWARRLERRPALLAAAAAAVMLTLAIPFLSLRIGSSDQGNDPQGTTTRKAYDLLAKGFGPGFNGPLQLVADARTAQQQADFQNTLNAVRRTPGIVATTPALHAGGGVLMAEAIPSTSPQAAATTTLLRQLRHTVIPRASGETRVLVGGQTAIFEDFSRVLSAKLPLFIGVVVLLSFLLLTVVFRSLVIPAMAAAMNLLSVAAGFGVVVAMFQWGWAAHLIGVDHGGPIEAFAPVLVFAILFGLSMDYEVFLVSRIYEEWHKRRDNREAVVHGLAATGRTITAAAAIMVLVFAAFVLGGERVIKLFGVGLATSVLLDALVVRSVLIPGLMLLVGKLNWALPRALERRLPRLRVEGAGPQPEQARA